MNANDNRPESFDAEITALQPQLRGFAMGLCRNRDVADDLVNDTLVKALAAHAQYQPETNMIGWLKTICRNCYYVSLRRSKKNPVDFTAAEFLPDIAAASAEQDGVCDLADTMKALSRLPYEQQQAVVQVGVNGVSYQDYAIAAGIPEGTVKSRLSRARLALQAAA